MSSPPEAFYEKLSQWLIPFLLATLVAVLGWMGGNIASISNSLAVAVSRIESHEQRITNLEVLFLHTRP